MNLMRSVEFSTFGRRRQMPCIAAKSGLNRLAVRGNHCVRRISMLLGVGLAILLTDSERIDAQQIPEAVLKRTKHATVAVRVKLATGDDVEGTGWFVEPGVVVTNAHVLNLHGGDRRPPLTLEIVIDGGEKTSKKLPAKIFATDSDWDLALLRVEGDSLPEPIAIDSATEPLESQDVFVFGYPFGKKLGASITVSKSSVSSLRRDGELLKEIQLNGGINPGNSGGPVVNQEGAVVGIAVGTMQQAAVGFAVPVEQLARMLNGRLSGIKTEYPYLKDGQVLIPVKVNFYDPLGRIGKVRIEYWVGQNANNSIRPASNARPETVEGDGPIEIVEVIYEKNRSKLVELPLKPLSEEKECYWIRAAMIDGRGKEFWSAASGNIRPDPLERREVTLRYQPKPGPAAQMQLMNNSSFKSQIAGRSQTAAMRAKFVVNSTIMAPEADGDIHTKFKFHSASLGLKINNESVNVKEIWNPVTNALVHKTSGDIEYGEDGAAIYANFDTTKVDPKFREPVISIGDQIVQSYDLLSIPLPRETLRPDDKIRVQRMVLVGTPGSFFPAQADVKYQYRGVHKLKDDREAALFEITGVMRPRRGDNTRLVGAVVGKVDISVDTGELLSGSGGMNVDLSVDGTVSTRLVGSLGIDLRPAPPPANKSSPGKDKPAEEEGTVSQPSNDTPSKSDKDTKDPSDK